MVVTEGYDVLEVSTLELSDVVCLEDRYGRIKLNNHQGSNELLGRIKTNHFSQVLSFKSPPFLLLTSRAVKGSSIAYPDFLDPG